MVQRYDEQARKILALQKEDGCWGYFHTLSGPERYPISTEQALRRLSILGFTMADEPIRRAVSYMDDCLAGRQAIPDRREKTHNWDLFTAMMLATWIRRFVPDHDHANQIARSWASVITAAFATGAYDAAAYNRAYSNTFGLSPRGARFEDFVSFYQVSLLSDTLDATTEATVFDYILRHPHGIYYIYEAAPLVDLPPEFATRQASRYLGAIALMADYRRQIHKLSFVADWLAQQRNENGGWDMGGTVNDKIYFPLSASWRPKGARENDCTDRITRLLTRLAE